MRGMITILVCSLLLNAAPASAQVEVVAAVKQALEARHVSLEGPCGAFEITKRVAWALRGQGYGLLEKTGGTNCQGYSQDYITLQDGLGIDILGDAGGDNIPSWGMNEPPGALTGRWRAPFDPGDGVSGPGPAQPPVTGIESALNLLQQTLNEFRQEFHNESLLQNEERLAQREFRQAVKSEYAKFGMFVAKYIAPAIGALLLGRQLAQ